jgi:hypothetical protein
VSLLTRRRRESCDDWCCQRNPVKLADRPVIKTTETRIKFLDQPELEKLLALPYPDDAFGQIEPGALPDSRDDRAA